jgi:hypothetical protein
LAPLFFDDGNASRKEPVPLKSKVALAERETPSQSVVCITGAGIRNMRQKTAAV